MTLPELELSPYCTVYCFWGLQASQRINYNDNQYTLENLTNISQKFVTETLLQ